MKNKYKYLIIIFIIIISFMGLFIYKNKGNKIINNINFFDVILTDTLDDYQAYLYNGYNNNYYLKGTPLESTYIVMNSDGIAIDDHIRTLAKNNIQENKFKFMDNNILYNIYTLKNALYNNIVDIQWVVKKTDKIIIEKCSIPEEIVIKENNTTQFKTIFQYNDNSNKSSIYAKGLTFNMKDLSKYNADEIIKYFINKGVYLTDYPNEQGVVDEKYVKINDLPLKISTKVESNEVNYYLSLSK